MLNITTDANDNFQKAWIKQSENKQKSGIGKHLIMIANGNS